MATFSVFYALVIFAAVTLWFLLSFTFPILGKMVRAIIDDTKVNIKKDINKGEKNE